MPVQVSWTTDFLRQALLGGNVSHAVEWASVLMDTLHRHKPDHEIAVFGFSRLPRMPNFFLGATGERLPAEPLCQVYLDEKNVDLFLGPRHSGLRLLKEEYPLTLRHEVLGSPTRKEIRFYEAICFDGHHSSIVMGLTLTETPVNEFFTTDEMSTLHALVNSHAIPMLELDQYKWMNARKEEEIKLMMGVVRDSTADSRLPLVTSSLPPSSSDPGTAESGFLTYLTAELRQHNNSSLAAEERLLQMMQGGHGSPQMVELTNAVHNASLNSRRILRNLSNMASLSHPEVRPKKGGFAFPVLVKELAASAQLEAAHAKVRLVVEEGTRNLFAAGDRETIGKMFDRIVKFHLGFCRPGCEMFLRTDDNPERTDPGTVMIELEDNGETSREVNPANLLTRATLPSFQHPRLQQGGGVLYQLMILFFEKTGGRFRLARGLNGGFAAQILLPQISRTEMERLKVLDASRVQESAVKALR